MKYLKCHKTIIQPIVIHTNTVNSIKNQLSFLMKMGLTDCLYKYYCINYLQTTFFKLDINMFEKWQGINPMGLSAPWSVYKGKQIRTNMKM